MADGGAEGVVEVERPGDALVEHAKPLFGRVRKSNRAKQIRGLDDDLQGVREVMGELADLFGDGFRENLCRAANLFILLRLLLFHRRLPRVRELSFRDNHSGNRGLTGAEEGEKLASHVAKPFVLKGFVGSAEMAELADARGSGPRTRKGVGVRVPSSAP